MYQRKIHEKIRDILMQDFGFNTKPDKKASSLREGINSHLTFPAKSEYSFHQMEICIYVHVQIPHNKIGE